MQKLTNTALSKSLTQFHPKFELEQGIMQGALTTIINQFNHEKGAIPSLNATFATGYTALSLASNQSNLKLVLLLLFKGAQPEVPDKNKLTTFHHLLNKGEHECLIIVLNYQRIIKCRDLFVNLYNLKHEYGYKNVEIVNGVLIDAVFFANEEHTKKHAQLNEKLEALFKSYIDEVLGIYRKALLCRDYKGMTPIHRALSLIHI